LLSAVNEEFDRFRPRDEFSEKMRESARRRGVFDPWRMIFRAR
jgi:hypothetical protein